jgi:hypothetical protein
MTWEKFDSGKSIGGRGSEEGVILADIEHLRGARVTLEKGGVTAPYSVTLGIYGLFLVHTYFASTLENAEIFVAFAKSKIDEIFVLNQVPPADQGQAWNDQLHQRMKELCDYP